MGLDPSEVDWSRNKFPLYAAAFMLPAMQGFDKKSHGVDLLGRDFIVLGKLIYMLGVCMRCTALHPEASALAPSLLDMLSSRRVLCWLPVGLQAADGAVVGVGVCWPNFPKSGELNTLSNTSCSREHKQEDLPPKRATYQLRRPRGE